MLDADWMACLVSAGGGGTPMSKVMDACHKKLNLKLLMETTDLGMTWAFIWPLKDTWLKTE